MRALLAVLVEWIDIHTRGLVYNKGGALPYTAECIRAVKYKSRRRANARFMNNRDYSVSPFYPRVELHLSNHVLRHPSG